VEGTPFGRYQLIDLLGRGGMGEVWKAFDTATQRVVAVKVLSAQLAADPVFERRFRREAFAAASLNNPHVVPIHNFGEIEGRLYVDMRLIEGEDLEHVLANGALDPRRAVEVIEQIASALNAAHRVGLVHRDVKPSNILLAEDDFAYLIDFGIARGAGETGLTGTGNVIGTWPYMAPERFSTGRSDTPSDIYALTCVLYECLTASRPFPGESVEQQIAGHLTTPPPRPSLAQLGVSPQLDDVIAVGMAKDPEKRYPTTTALARAARKAITTPIPRIPQRSDAGPSASAPTQRRMPAQGHEPWAPTRRRPAEYVEDAWAPTQHRPAENIEEVTAPAQRRPDTEPPWPWWRRKGIVIPIGVILLIAALVTILFAMGGEQTARQGGPLDGTFAVEFASATRPNGQPYDNAPGGQETWVIQSACRSGACVATASKLSGSQSAASTLVLDKVGGTWTAVSATSGTCQDARTEYWESMSLEQRSDGTLAGEFVVRSTTSCARNQQVTFTRTGNVEGNVSIADPQAQPARVVSAAQALHGRYQETDTYAADGRTAQANFDIQTYCLRTGERCLSFWLNPDDVKNLVFSEDKWVLTNTSSAAECKSGGSAQREISLEYPLPQPKQDPIILLTGRGHYTITGACPFNSDFDSRVERTGD
jgi:predicted Ser/Thr protein kinase